jgi:6-phosphogluconolactonase (cycloisomerase 2 family)
MTKRTVGFCLALSLVTALSAFAQNAYVDSNIGQMPDQNSVSAYWTNSMGLLTPIVGSPFLTGGTGVFSSNPLQAPGFMADQELVTNAARTLLFAVNGHSNTISSFSIQSDGSLTLVGNVNSGGQDPVSLALDEKSLAGTQLSVINQAQDPSQSGGVPNLTSFLVGSSGVLTPVARSTVSFPTQCIPFEAVASPSGKFLFTVESNAGGTMNSYSIGAGGKFVLNNSVSPALGSHFMGIAVHPVQRAIYVAVPDTNLIEIYTYNTQGALAYHGSVNNPGQGVGWLAVSTGGYRLYSAESGSNSVTMYDLTESKYLKPVVLQHVTLKPGGSPANIKVSAGNTFLYVLGLDETGSGSSYLHAINTGNQLSETSNPVAIPEPSGEIAEGIAITY